MSNPLSNTLFVKSIFKAIDGEVNGFRGAGQVTTFLRLAGCNLRCSYCDTKYALQRSDGEARTIVDVADELRWSPKISITGGEPLTQQWPLISLIEQMGDGMTPKQQISIETNGSITVVGELRDNPNVRIVMDYKMPASGEEHNMMISTFLQLEETDVVKFVLNTEDEYNYMKILLANQLHTLKAQVAVSPAIFEKDPKKTYYPTACPLTWARELAELLITNEDWDIQYSLQIHKVLWPNATEER